MTHSTVYSEPAPFKDEVQFVKGKQTAIKGMYIPRGSYSMYSEALIVGIRLYFLLVKIGAAFSRHLLAFPKDSPTEETII